MSATFTLGPIKHRHICKAGKVCLREERKGSKIIPVRMSLLGKDEIKDWLTNYQYLISETGMEVLQAL